MTTTEQTNERDQLRGTLANTICNASLYARRAQPYLLGSDMSDVLDKTADAIVAAGYRKPRTITTVEELDALPEGSVIRDAFRGRVFHRRGLAGWQCAGMTLKAEIVLPVTVLHTPEQSA